MKTTFLAVTLILCSGFFSGLEAQARPRYVLVVHKTEGFHNNFWDSLQMGARKEAAKLSVDLVYRGVPVSFEHDRIAGQMQVIQEEVDRGAAGILLTPLDRIRLATSVKYAAVRGVPVVAVDSAVESNLLSGIVATNNYAASLAATKAMTGLMGKKGSVIMLAHPSKENKATRDRELAFLAGLAQYAPEIKVLSAERSGGATFETDLLAAQALLKDYPSVTGVYCVNGSGLAAFMRALEEAGRSSKVTLVGWDADPVTIEGLRRGSVSMIVQQDPERMGATAVQMVHEAAMGRPRRVNADTGVHLITRANMDKPEFSALLFPSFGQWIK